MLIIPLTGKRFRENLPYFTIAIILINCLVYFILQAGDSGSIRRAAEYYQTSGLADIEVPLYLSYLEERGEKPPAAFSGKSMDAAQRRMVLHGSIEGDGAFLGRLARGEAFGGDSALFRKWRKLRTEYESLRSQAVSYSYGLKPARPTAATFVSYMFLHGSFSHLLGNMVFLWIMGCLIEAGCGRSVFLLEYLLGGVLSAGLYCLVYSRSLIPLVGASGAIAALMGIFTVLYGRRRIKIFYSLGVYFSTITIPAIVVLPFWVGNELFQLLSSGASHVAYMAHVGGLLSGALMGGANRILPMPGAEAVPDQPAEPEDSISPLMEQALEKIADLELPAAEKLLEEVLCIDGQHPDALRHLFHIRKLEPQTARFQATAGHLISLLLKAPDTREEALRLYREYRDLPRRRPLQAALYLQLSTALSARGSVEDAEKILAVLIRKRPDFPGISTALFKLAAACRDRGLKDRWQRYRRVICARFPDSDEARVLRQQRS
jgi:membrane associated rhomboid family serine protease